MIRDIKRQIEKAKQSKRLIIVEGKKDKQALEKLGFENEKIFLLNNGKSIKRNIEIINEMARNVIILTDFDKKGKELYKKLKQDLGQMSIKIDNSLRNSLSKQVSHIQGLANFIDQN